MSKVYFASDSDKGFEGEPETAAVIKQTPVERLELIKRELVRKENEVKAANLRKHGEQIFVNNFVEAFRGSYNLSISHIKDFSDEDIVFIIEDLRKKAQKTKLTRLVQALHKLRYRYRISVDQMQNYLEAYEELKKLDIPFPLNVIRAVLQSHADHSKKLDIPFPLF